MPGTGNRDLASVELWQDSLERSQRRRVLAADARKDQARKKTASVAVSAAVAASPMWPSVTATAADLSKEDAGKLAHKLQHNHAERVLLEFGDTSSAVAELQRALGIADDGIFGPHTRAAVKAFQKEHGLLTTGKVDVKTWLKVFPTDMIVYAPPGSASALGVNDTNHPEWAAVSANAANAAAGNAATLKAAAHGKSSKHDPAAGVPSVHAASIGSTGPAVSVGPNGLAPGGSGPGIPGLLHGGSVAPNGGGGGGGGGGSFHFPSLGSFGSAKEMLRAMIGMANRIDSHHYAYRWGGGHNAGFSGPYDCSGAVSAVLHAAGLLNRPMVSGEFMHWGAPGRGAVTIYANAGHVYMSILGHFFGTTHANPGGGAGWFPGAPRSGFAVVHVPFSKLHFKGHTKHKRHKRHRRRHTRRHTTQQSGPLNQPATTPPPSQSGGSTAPSSSSPPTTTTASNQSSTSSPPAQSTPAPSQPGTATPNGQPAPVAQPQVAPAAPAPAPVAQAAPQAAPPVAGNGTPNGVPAAPAPVPQAPAPPAPKLPATGQGSGQGTGTPQAPKPPVAQPNQPQQPQQAPAPAPNATGQQTVQHAAEPAGQAPSTAPPKPPAGGGQGQGSAPNSGK